jgi:hypothetical protein
MLPEPRPAPRPAHPPALQRRTLSRTLRYNAECLRGICGAKPGVVRIHDALSQDHPSC